MAIFELSSQTWNCSSIGDLPNDTQVDPNAVSGLLLTCDDDGRVAVWVHFPEESWGCSPAAPLLTQVVGNVNSICVPGDIFTYNDVGNGRPSALCEDPHTRQVGPDAVVKLTGTKRDSRALLKPDEAFYVQTASKAIGFISTYAPLRGWQYWRWSPLKTASPSNVGTFPPILLADSKIVAVTVATWGRANFNPPWTTSSQSFTLNLVTIAQGATGYTVNTIGTDLVMASSKQKNLVST